MKSHVPFTVRQGDVLLEKIDEAELGEALPRDAGCTGAPGRIVLAYGEVTGHAHAIHEPDAQLFRGKASNADVFLRVVAPVSLRHEEHSTIAVPPGLYRVRRQREWSDSDEPVQVAD
jgi:hypothetical protein